jgi:hypothetical protein
MEGVLTDFVIRCSFLCAVSLPPHYRTKSLDLRSRQGFGRFRLLTVCLSAALLATRLLAADADLHDFTDQQGRTLKAEIINVIGQEVSLQRADGENFKVKISIFSSADQDFIRQWALKEAADAKGDALTFVTSTLDSNNTTSQSSNQTIQRWLAGFKVTLTNQSSMELQKLHVDYQLFKHEAIPGAADPSTDPVNRTAGSFTLDLVPPNGDQTFVTTKIPLSSYALNAGYTWASGANRMVSDDLLGIWLRVYADNGDLIQEWCSRPGLMKKEKWDDGSLKKPVAGGGED